MYSRKPRKYVTILLLLFILAFIAFFRPTKLLSERSNSNDDLVHDNKNDLVHVVIPTQCLCEDKNTGERFNFCYSLPENKSIHGQRFDCAHRQTLEKLGFLSGDYIDLTKFDLSEPTFVTAFSSNHEPEGQRLFKEIRSRWPDRKVVVYDLGIREPEYFKALGNVELRKFNFDQYPIYMKNLHDYRWKPVIVAETLREFGAIWWMDTSIVFNKTDWSHVYELMKCKKNQNGPNEMNKSIPHTQAEVTKNRGWNRKLWKQNINECQKVPFMFNEFSSHGIIAATDPGVYKFIPTNMNMLKKKKTSMWGANFIFAARTQETMEKIVYWWVLCALEEHCMAPPGAQLSCDFDEDRFDVYAGCHRYDQATSNLIAANAYDYDAHRYRSEIVDFFQCVRIN